MKLKAIIFLLLSVGFFSAYAQTIPEEFYFQSELYENYAENEELGISIDKFSYNPSETVNILGYVVDFKQGQRIFMKVIDPQGNVYSQISAPHNNDGVFKVVNVVGDGDKDIIGGNYILEAKYGSGGSTVSLSFDIEDTSIRYLISIPRGANVEGSSFTYSPQMLTAEAGLPIVWINEDVTQHTIVSGQFGFRNKIFTTGQFDSGIVGPNEKFEIILQEGNYMYFCMLHPWLNGFLAILPSTDPAYTVPPPDKQVVAEEIEQDILSVEVTRPYYELNPIRNLFDENIASNFVVWAGHSSNYITVSDTLSARSGINSLQVNVDINEGRGGIYHDFVQASLQDWSDYDNISFWFKGQNTKQTLLVQLGDEYLNAPDKFTFIDDSHNWKNIRVPLDFFSSIDLTKVRRLSIGFTQGISESQFEIDDIKVVSQKKDTSLADDNMDSWFSAWAGHYSNFISFSDTLSARSGINSLQVNVDINEGRGGIYHDFVQASLQDWSDYDNISFWFKGQNTKQTLLVQLGDEYLNAPDKFTFIDDSHNWKNIRVPLDFFSSIDLTKVRRLSIGFTQGISESQFEIDDIKVSRNINMEYVQTGNNVYIAEESILIVGEIQNRESDSPVIIQVFNPTKNLVHVSQVIPNPDNTFSLLIKTSGAQFRNEGEHIVLSTYGMEQYQTESSFIVLQPNLTEENYNGFNIYTIGETIYAIPHSEGSFDINLLKNGEYTEAVTDVSIENLKETIDSMFPKSEIKQEPIGEVKIEPKPEPKPEVVSQLPTTITTEKTQPELDESMIPIYQITIAVILIIILGVFGFRYFYLTRKTSKISPK